MAIETKYRYLNLDSWDQLFVSVETNWDPQAYIKHDYLNFKVYIWKYIWATKNAVHIFNWV